MHSILQGCSPGGGDGGTGVEALHNLPPPSFGSDITHEVRVQAADNVE